MWETLWEEYEQQPPPHLQFQTNKWTQENHKTLVRKKHKKRSFKCFATATNLNSVAILQVWNQATYLTTLPPASHIATFTWSGKLLVYVFRKTLSSSYIRLFDVFLSLTSFIQISVATEKKFKIKNILTRKTSWSRVGRGYVFLTGGYKAFYSLLVF